METERWFKILMITLATIGCMSKWTPISALSFVASGAASTGSSSLTPGIPAGIQAGDILEMWIENKYPAAPPTVPTGWLLVDQTSGGSGSSGLNSGQVLMTLLVKICDGTESGTVALTITGGNSTYTRITAFRKDYRMVWDIATAYGSDNTGGTDAISIASSASLAVTAGDYMTAAFGVNTNAYSFNVPTFTQSGITFGSITKHFDSGTSTGDDSKLVACSGLVTAGTATATITLATTTQGGGSTADSPCGAGIFARLRQVAAFNHVSVTNGMFDWDPSTATLPAGNDYSLVEDGDYFWQNTDGIGLRAAPHWTGLNYNIDYVNGIKRYIADIHPRTPDFSGAGHYNYRAEVTQDWESGIPLNSRQLLSWFYEVPSPDGMLDRDFDLVVHQSHPGSAPGYSSNSPCYYLSLAYSGQPTLSGGPAAFNELVLVDKVRAFENANNGCTKLGVVADPGDILQFSLDTVFGNLNIPGAVNGHLIIWVRKIVAGVKGAWTKVYDQAGSTVWAAAADGGSNPQVGGDWKLLAYGHGVRTLAEVQDNEALNGGAPGDYYILLYLGRIRAFLLAPTYVYRYANLFAYMDLSNYG